MLGVMLKGVVVATRAVEESPATVDGPVAKVEPQVGGEVATLAFPAFGRHTDTVIELNQRFGVNRRLQLFPFPRSRCGLELPSPRGRRRRQNPFGAHRDAQRQLGVVCERIKINITS